jgi:hypothetical protein
MGNGTLSLFGSLNEVNLQKGGINAILADSDFFGLAENAEKQVLHISSLEKGEINA